MTGFIKKIEQINFGLMSPEDIRNMSVVTVETPDTYEDDGFPIEKGLMDPRLGVIDPSLVCRTCGFRGGDCQGHFGSIELARPVIHIGFGDVIHKILRSTCNECGRVLLTDDVIEEYATKINEAKDSGENISNILKELYNATKTFEVKEEKQDEIVRKIWNDYFPDGVDELEYSRIETILKSVSKQLFTDAYISGDDSPRTYIDAKMLCPHCKKNSTLDNIETTFEEIESKAIQGDIDYIFNFNKIISSKNSELNKELDKILRRLKKLFKAALPEDVPDEEMDPYTDFESSISELRKEISDSKDVENSISIYRTALGKFDDNVLKKLNITENDENSKDFNKYLESVEDAGLVPDGILESFEEDKARQVRTETRNYIKTYLQKLIQEPIKLDKPVTIRQGDYKLTASEVRERLERITDDDSFVLGVNPEVARPEWLVLTVLPVPPVTVRPSITLDTGERSEDDLTHKLVDILRINQRLLENMEAGAPQLIVEDLWELLQYHVTTYFDNEASGVPPARHRSGRPLKTLTQRLKGKEGRFRSNLSGKRVNFSARTVISPDPNISINEVGVPEMIAKEVTVPVYVNEWNMEEMKKYIKNGSDIHPGANYVIRKDGRKIRIRNEETIELILEQLEPGFIVERHLKDGDMVLFNRQPSLHRMSMMAHEVRVLPYKTFRLNLCVCPPYNADFDGDEMNMHVFQTDESRAEAKSLMRVQEHILSPRFGGPIIGAIHDHISGAYLLTRDGVEFTEEQALQIIRKSHLKLPEFKKGQWVLKTTPDLKPGMEIPSDIERSYIFKDKGAMWTGKELFSLLLPNDLNLSYTAEISKCPVVYPAEDATVVIKDGILVQGVIDESAYGSFSGKILDKIVKEYGPGRAKEFLDRATDLAICGIMKTGITTSLNDEEIPQEAQDRINEHLDNKMAEVDKLVESYEEGYLQALPGRSLEETLEMKIMQVLGEARDMSGSIAENYLTMGKQSDDDPYDHVMAVENHSVVMARTGARASMLNLTQITACVGQQAVRGGRIERGYLNRTLPHFKKGELGAKAKGFVHSSYKSGLDPIEFFFHAMGGREGLVDTAIRTAQSGYMQRRLVNALQDLQVKPSGLVTDNQGNVIQTMFGEDGVDPAKSDFGKPADLHKLIDEIRIEEKLNQEGK
ncbi:DNA-directed RNA polymerase subunit A' [Methanobrevibacter sp.]|uniref:DNA-directed RNA polymerase subunit A' n=1 Tax=Methanobrevibacter sp. TaxID=66852 RepID=UPI0025FDF189|nr:DNA-directed RNA polymerase subunit A' [Methanobrevibacter sp.]MBQ2665326.1 DNA-directed RNA polymerase subunit A' [Methanobrevibacter sp.]